MSDHLPTLDEHDENPADPQNESSENASGEMSFLEHLEDLRWTLLKSFIAFSAACVVIAIFLGYFSALLQWPYEFAVTSRSGEQLKGLINTSILGVFSVIFYLMLGGGLALSLPFMLYFFGQFIAPGLTSSELKLLRPSCMAAFLLFIVGASFSFFVLVPAALRASILFNELLGFEALWTAASYYGLMTWMVIGVGMAFEFPLILLILVYLNVINVDQLVKFRKLSFVVFLCIGAVVTPTTDPVTFILLALPLTILYELAIIGARRIPQKEAPIEEEDIL